MNFLLLRNPTERAVYLFIRATLQRSIPLRMRITAWAAGGLGLIFVLFIFEGGGRRTGAGSGLLSAAVMGILFLMLGLRSAVRTPVSPRSRWVFRLTEIPGSMAVRRSLIKAAAVMLAAPATFMIFLMFQLGGGEMGAFQAALYGFGVALLVLNVLFSDLAMIPFACLSRPGREKLQVFWLVYIAAIFVFVKGFAALGEAVIREWMSLIGFLLSTLLFILILEAARPLLFPSGNRLVFEEPPEPVMLGLDGETSPE